MRRKRAAIISEGSIVPGLVGSAAAQGIYDSLIKKRNGGLAFMGAAALIGKRIVIAGSQKTNEMSVIIAKQGGMPLVRSLQGLTVFDESLLAEPLQQLASEGRIRQDQIRIT